MVITATAMDNRRDRMPDLPLFYDSPGFYDSLNARYIRSA